MNPTQALGKDSLWKWHMLVLCKFHLSVQDPGSHFLYRERVCGHTMAPGGLEARQNVVHGMKDEHLFIPFYFRTQELFERTACGAWS